MRYQFMIPLVLLGTAVSAPAQVRVGIGIGLPGVNIGVNFPVYPDLERVPGYPVYYAPGLDSNYFFYDGMYWVFQGDNWYASSWYNGPWSLVGQDYVPVFMLRIPVSYYRRPPMFFRGWQRDASPRWGEHWGRGWEQRRSGWDRWDRRTVPAPAQLPTYQRNYSGNRYPGVEHQRELHNQNYRYQPKEAIVREHYQRQNATAAAAPSERGKQREPQPSNPRQRESQPRYSNPVETQPRNPRPVEPPPNRSRPEDLNRPQAAPRPQPSGREQTPHPEPPKGYEQERRREAPREPRPEQGRGQEKEREHREERRPREK